MKRHPAVKDLCYTRMHFHYVWKNGFKTVFYDTLQAGAYTRMGSPGYFSVFGALPKNFQNVPVQKKW